MRRNMERKERETKREEWRGTLEGKVTILSAKSKSIPRTSIGHPRYTF